MCKKSAMVITWPSPWEVKNPNFQRRNFHSEELTARVGEKGLCIPGRGSEHMIREFLENWAKKSLVLKRGINKSRKDPVWLGWQVPEASLCSGGVVCGLRLRTGQSLGVWGKEKS